MTLNRRVLRKVNSPHKSPKRHNTSLRKKALIKKISGDVQFGAASKANVKVVVRVRPYNTRELERNDKSIVKVVDDHMLIFDPKEDEDDFFFKGVRQRTRDLNRRTNREQKFVFEKVFDQSSTNDDLYEETTKNVIDTILDGYNCSVFAYGATGAGKTFTMLGSPECPGITFLTLMELYRRIEEVKDTKTCEVGVSYLEVYNETVRDLLQPGKHLNVQESGSNVLIPGLSLHKPKDADDLMKMLAFGNQNRSQHPTDANAESSRSHAVFQIFVRQQDRTAGLKSNLCIAKLSMIDLAGSERGAATGYKGARFREGANINKSLLALGNCINALADGQRHIPYRDSKLTRLLKDSLGGNCRSVMIAAVSPASSSFEDTFNTLRYANRAKTIKTTLKKNMMNVDQHVSQYVKIVEDLRQEIGSLKEKIKLLEEKESDWESDKAKLEMANEALEKQNELEDEVQNLEQKLQEKVAADIKTQSMVSVVSEEELDIQKTLEDTSCERKSLRRELLQLESSQREIEIKIYNCNLRLQRMKIISFASQRLDKSISKCERTIRNLTDKLAQTKKLQLIIEEKLQCNLNKLYSIEKELNEFGPDSSQPSHTSKSLIEKSEASLLERDMAQLTDYLKGVIKEGLVEQTSSDSLIRHLLQVVRLFYVQLRANHVCSPEMEQLFEGVIDKLDESKIVWADEQKGKISSSMKPVEDAVSQPELDVIRILELPLSSNVFISPTVHQENNRHFRRSIMKSNSTSCLQNKLLHGNEVNSPLKVIQESNITTEVPLKDSGTPESPPLSFSAKCDNFDLRPSPVIGSTQLPVKGKVLLDGLETSRIIDDVGTISSLREKQGSDFQLPLTTISSNYPSQANAASADPIMLSTMSSDDHLSPVLSSGYSNYKKKVSFGFVSMTENIASDSAAHNRTELLEDIQPLDYSMNSTFAITPAKNLNVTMDMPSSGVKSWNTTIDTSSNVKSLNTTDDMPNNVKSLNTTVDMPNNVKSLNTTVDMPNNVKSLNTTVDMPNNVKSLNTTVDMPNNVKSLNTTVDMPNYVKSLNTTVDMPSNFKGLDTTVDMPSNVKSLNTTIDKPSIVAKSLNTTMDKPSIVAKSLNTTMDKPSIVAKSLNTTMDKPSIVAKSLNTTIDKPSIVAKSLNTTIDLQVVGSPSLSDPKPTKIENAFLSTADVLRSSNCISDMNSLTTRKPSYSTISAADVHLEKPCVSSQITSESSSRRLFTSGNLDATFSFDGSPLGCSELQESPSYLVKPNGSQIQRLPLAPLENICVQPKPTIEVIVTNNADPMPPPSSTKKIIPKKTPGKTSSNLKGSISTSHLRTSSSLRRSLSTSSLTSTASSNMRQSMVSPVFKRKQSALSGALNRTASFLKNSKGKNQENLPPGNNKAFTPNFKSLANKKTISSMAKHVTHSLQKT